MKIREIMKRTMAIGLATAMLLQSQSVVTLAETVQADAAETVVVDVGEETSVSGNGNDEWSAARCGASRRPLLPVSRRRFLSFLRGSAYASRDFLPRGS